MLRKQFLETSRGRIAALLQRAGMTVADIGAELSLTPNAVRAQLTTMERDGLVRRAGRIPGATRPSHLFELTSEVEQLLSRAYIPLLTHMVRAFAQGLRRDRMNKLMQQAGKSLASEFPLDRRTHDVETIRRGWTCCAHTRGSLVDVVAPVFERAIGTCGTDGHGREQQRAADAGRRSPGLAIRNVRR